jgi:glutathione peroxidase
MQDIDGERVDFERYRDRTCLIVNVASKCGYTPQYEGLQALHEAHHEEGLSVLGFPCNQFADEEPGTEPEIKDFCRTRYGVQFDMFSKIQVKGSAQAPLYEWLTSEENPWGPHRVRWNFQKYLVDRTGEIAWTFDPIVEPDDPYFTKRLERVMAGAPASTTG